MKKTAENFKEEAIALLRFCLAETKSSALRDEFDEEETALNDSYCEGLEDAIEKIEGLSVYKSKG